jgi:N-acetylglucosamine-6-sulfatase
MKRAFTFLALACISITLLRAEPLTTEKNARERTAPAKPRNVLFILSDDHRYDAMSFLGHPLAKTPVMDSLAKQGACFKNAFVITSLCSPSRASILTGLHTLRHGIIDNQHPVPEGTEFFPQRIQRAGYKTAFIGKWHMGDENDAPRPGFDYWLSFAGQGDYLPPTADYTLNLNGQRVKQDGYITDVLTDYAVEWLKSQKKSDQPFFLYLSHKAVHSNFTPAKRHEGQLNGATLKRPDSEDTTTANRTQPRWLRDQRNSWHGVEFPYHSELNIGDYYKRYCETLMSLDESIGRVLDTLKEMGIYDDTLVIYMGDNGFLFGEHGLIDKRVAYEPSMRVPLLMQCPSLIKAGTVVEKLAANIDIAPTVLEAMGVEKPSGMDGQSLLPLAEGKDTPWRDTLLYVYFWEKTFPQTPTTFALRGERYKYITYHGVWDTDELYDLEMDPSETNNIIHDPKYADLASRMEKEMYDAMERSGPMRMPLNRPMPWTKNLRFGPREGRKAADFPDAMVADQPVNIGAD